MGVCVYAAKFVKEKGVKSTKNLTKKERVKAEGGTLDCITSTKSKKRRIIRVLSSFPPSLSLSDLSVENKIKINQPTKPNRITSLYFIPYKQGGYTVSRRRLLLKFLFSFLSIIQNFLLTLKRSQQHAYYLTWNAK